MPLQQKWEERSVARSFFLSLSPPKALIFIVSPEIFSGGSKDISDPLSLPLHDPMALVHVSLTIGHAEKGSGTCPVTP